MPDPITGLDKPSEGRGKINNFMAEYSIFVATVGARALGDLTDVVLNNPQVGEGLVYDGTQWENGAVSGGGGGGGGGGAGPYLSGTDSISAGTRSKTVTTTYAGSASSVKPIVEANNSGGLSGFELTITDISSNSATDTTTFTVNVVGGEPTSALAFTWIIGIGGGVPGLAYIGSVTALRSLSGADTVPAGQVRYLRGTTTSADGGEGSLYYDDADTTTADNNVNVYVDAAGRRWKRLSPWRRPELTLRSTFNVTLLGSPSESPVQYFGSALSADVSLTLPSPGTYTPSRVTVVRAAAATGAFNVNIKRIDNTTIKSLASAGTWSEVAHDGSTWYVIRSGSV